MEELSKTSDTMTHIDFIKCYINDNDYHDKLITDNLDSEDVLNEIKEDITTNILTINNSSDENKKYMLKRIIDFQFNNLISLKKRSQTLKNIVSELEKLELPEQRSKEWFDLRKNVLTASSLASALGECHFKSREQLICDKSSEVEAPYTSNPITEWGVKYEEIATKFYELVNNVKILEFGLIPHPDFKIFGASPDGICSNDSSDEYVGRMLEIKVPPKRKFTKTVPKPYGYQMQGQMECCNLEECDFLQVKIEEYENEEEYINDEYIYNGVLKEGYNCENLPKGCTLTYQMKDSLSYSYLYPELCLTHEESVSWIKMNKDKIKNEGHVFIEAKWWKITRYECTLVKRDRVWWANSMEKIYDFWEEVKYYRSNDRTELLKRVSKKTNKRRVSESNPYEVEECLIMT
jgi:putative phage-type endonuclease